MGHYAAQHAFEEDFWIIPPLSSSSSTALQEHCLRGSYTLPLGTELCGLYSCLGTPQDHSFLQAARRHLRPSTGMAGKVFG